MQRSCTSPFITIKFFALHDASVKGPAITGIYWFLSFTTLILDILAFTIWVTWWIEHAASQCLQPVHLLGSIFILFILAIIQ